MISATYICHSGDDLLVVNAARVSFSKRSEVMTDTDAKLIHYLARNGHRTPFAHPQITLHLKAPIFVRTQCFKHKVGFVENEVSRRYVDEAPTFWEPETWRTRAADKKQGSSDDALTGEHAEFCTAEFRDLMLAAAESYGLLVSKGVAPEIARAVLPQAMITEWFWTGSLAAWERFVKQRTDPHAQEETARLARACAELIEPLFPVSWAALLTARVA